MSVDFSKAIDERCGSTNNYTALNVFSASSTTFLMLLSIFLNALVVFVLIEDRKQKRYKSLFYKLLLNIAVADLLTGLVADPSTVNVLVREALIKKVSQAEYYAAHLSIFFTDAVALCTLTLLSMDRVMAIVSPVKHFKGMEQATRYVLVACTWIIGFCLVLPYFKLKFIRQLFVFATINITITVLSLIMTIVLYRLKLKPSTSTKHKTKMGQVVVKNLQSESVKIDKDNNLGSFTDDFNVKLTSTEITERKTPNDSIDGGPAELDPVPNTTNKKPLKEVSNHAKVKSEKVTQDIWRKTVKVSGGTKIPDDGVNSGTTVKPVKISIDAKVRRPNRGVSGDNFMSKKQARNQQKATRTFLIMLCVFLVTYLPTAIAMIFMNVCSTCDCLAIHIMRDVSSILILSSSVFRPLNFILTLKHLRTSVFLKLRIKKRRSRDVTNPMYLLAQMNRKSHQTSVQSVQPLLQRKSMPALTHN